VVVLALGYCKGAIVLDGFSAGVDNEMSVYLGGIDGLKFRAAEGFVLDLDFRDIEGGSLQA
jgi:hypothetical protein